LNCGAKVLARRSSGKSHAQRAVTPTAAAPPMTTALTGPRAAAADTTPRTRSVGGLPNGRLTAYPFGLLQRPDTSEEWAQDWYAEEAYINGVSQDPQGRASGTEKVMRSWGGDSLKIGVAVWRRKEEPIPMWEPEGKLIPGPTSGSPSLRCAVNPAR